MSFTRTLSVTILRCVAILVALGMYMLFWTGVAWALFGWAGTRFCPGTLRHVLDDEKNLLMISCLVATPVFLVLFYAIKSRLQRILRLHNEAR